MTNTIRVLLPSTKTPYVDLPSALTRDEMDMACFRIVFRDHTGFEPSDCYTLDMARSWMESYMEADDEGFDMSLFSDLFKDRHGFRPRGYTVEQAKAWMEFPGPLSAEEIAEAEAETSAYIAKCEAEHAEWLKEWEEGQRLAEIAAEEKRADYGRLPWQVQAGKLRNLPETVILEY